MTTAAYDPLLHGHDPTPGIVAVHAEPSGSAIVWRREGAQVTWARERFRPWVYARDAEDLTHLGERLSWTDEGAAFHALRLRGDTGTLNHLLSAHDGRALRAAILAGASKRLGRRVTSLHDLRGYYVVGTLEQYLMRSGRTYYKGMAYGDVHRLQFDLETTGLSPESGRIFMVAVRDTRGFEAVLEAPTPEDEPALITELLHVIRTVDPDVIENHNLMRFDLPFLIGRAQVHGLEVDLGRAPGPRGVWRVQDGRSSPHWACAGRELVDTYDAVRRLDLPSAGLKAVSQYLGIAPSGRVYLEGAKIASTYQANPELVRTYALQDVEEVSLLAERVLTPSFALAQLAPRAYGRLPYAGPATGVLEPMLVRAYLHAGHALPGPVPASATQHQGGTVHLYAEGVLPRVVKADVASMYPSLIRAHRIGPRNDPLGVFLHLMDVLTERRLQHKAAARRGDPGEHHALQGAMKLIVNAGYGYLGAGHLALFADPAAADEVTRQGRRVLGQVVGALAERGVTLIEADTDGVYFSVPDGWTEPQERQLVADVDALLPSGVSLEFDGRFRAMLSHEIKNYALLGYDGRLTVRGAAFDSVRSEAYGRAFLARALPCLLTGDVPGVKAAYDDTLEALRARRLTNADVATRVRVTKSPEQYAASRAARREAPYEALLASGRTWTAGDRARLYVRTGVGMTLLDGAEDGRDYDIPHYERQLDAGYASRLRKAFTPEGARAVFDGGPQGGLFETPLADVQVIWHPC